MFGSFSNITMIAYNDQIFLFDIVISSVGLNAILVQRKDGLESIIVYAIIVPSVTGSAGHRFAQ